MSNNKQSSVSKLIAEIQRRVAIIQSEPQAMDLLLSVTRDVELYELQKDNSPSLSDFSRK